MIFTRPLSRARCLKSSSSPARTVRSCIDACTISSPAAISSGSVVAQYRPSRNSPTYVGTGYWPRNC